MAGLHNPFLLVVPVSDCNRQGYFKDFTVVRQGLTLSEYQLYAVEQWVVDREKPSSLIVASTNDPSHKILVDVLTPTADTLDARSAIWDRTMLKARTDGARPKQTHLGFILVVSLLGFRSDLTIVLLPSGSITSARDALFTNINLRRLGCGGRSGLNLSDPSLAQQERLLAVYRLPLSLATNMTTFTSTLLGLIKLVQSALALFNLGPLAHDPRGQLVPDGLLCDTTVDGLAAWQIEVAEPLLQAELGENILSSATLAALLSTVLSVRSRLVTMGVHHVPNDPFENRWAFLAAYENFMKSTKNAPDSRYLSAAGIYHFRQLYTRTTKESLKRAIRHRLDDIRGDSGTSSHHKASAFEDETTDIVTFVTAVQSHNSGELPSLLSLWKPKSKKEKSSTKKSSILDKDDAQVAPTNLLTDSEDETGIGTKIFKGVSKNAKRIGGGVTGLLDKTGALMNVQYSNKEEMPRYRPGNRLTENGNQDFSRSTTSEYLDPNVLLQGPSPGNSRLSVKSSSGNDSASTVDADDHRKLAPTRPTYMRRAATDMELQSGNISCKESSKRYTSRSRERRYSFDCMRNAHRLEEVMSVRRMKLDVDLHTTFSDLRKREAQLAKLVDALTAIDQAYEVALLRIVPSIRKRSHAVNELNSQAKQLSQDMERFTTSTATGGLISGQSGREPSTDADMNHQEHEAALALAISSERLSYAETILEEKINEIEDFERLLHSKIGGSEVILEPSSATGKRPSTSYTGTIILGLLEFRVAQGRSRSGTRVLLDSLSVWAGWSKYLWGRLKSYL